MKRSVANIDVTVVIPTRDRAAMLHEALRSVLNQVGVRLNVVVVDDGSTDHTADVVNEFDDRRITYTRNDKSEGVSRARNRGVTIADGEWVAFLDDDDLWSPKKLQDQLAAAEATRCQWAVGGTIAVNNHLEVLSGGPPSDGKKIVSILPYRNAVPAGASNVIVRKSALALAGPFDETLRHLADWDLWIRLGQIGAPATVFRPVVAYRIHDTNASADANAPIDIVNELKVIESRYEDLRANRDCDWASTYRWIAWNCLRRGERVEAARAYFKALATGDVRSAGRAAIGLVAPGLARRKLRRHQPDAGWMIQANEWLGQLTPA